MNRKRIAALFAALCMALTAFPVVTFADAPTKDFRVISSADAPTEAFSAVAFADAAETAPESVTETADSAGDAQEAASGTPEAQLFAPSIVASGECGADGDNVKWTLDSAGTLTISGKGTMADSKPSSPWFSKRSKIINLVIQSGVTSIGFNAFYYCSKMTSVIIPNSVTSIGGSAFRGCDGLTSVMIPDSVISIDSDAFAFCKGLTGITIPNGVTSIGNSAFSSCSSLTNVTISNSVTSIGSIAFYGCNALTDIYYGGTEEEWKAIKIDSLNSTLSKATIHYASAAEIVASGECGADGDNVTWTLDSAGTLTISGKGKMRNYNYDNRSPWYDRRESIANADIQSGVTSIGERAFVYCSGLTSVTIPDSVTSIGDDAFYDCSGLTSVTIPDSVTSIGKYAFDNCSGLTSVTISNGVTSISEHAFYDCHKLSSVTIPDSVTSIGDTAFAYCSALTSVTIPNSVTSIGTAAFYACSALTNVTIPNSVTSIGSSAFASCSGLTGVTIPDSVTSIKGNIFAFCSKLTSVSVESGNIAFLSENGILYNRAKSKIFCFPEGKSDASFAIPDSVTSIMDYAFAGCSGLTSVTIPEGVTSIGSNAFSGCSGLTSVTLPDSVTSIGSSTFHGCSDLTGVKIPEGVTSVKDDAFSGCSGLTSVIIPNRVISIGSHAFSDCSGLTSVTLPSRVNFIGWAAFYGCEGLTDIYYGGTEEEWKAVKVSDGNEALSNAAIHWGTAPEVVASGECGADGDNVKWTLDSAGTLTISGKGAMANYTFEDRAPWYDKKEFIARTDIQSGLTSIGDYAFFYCGGLINVTIPNGVTSVGKSAFRECSGLTSVTLPNSLTSIGGASFGDCKLTSVTLPDGLTSIGDRAFSGCDYLLSVTIPDSVTSIGDLAFSYCLNLRSVNAGSGNSAFFSEDGVLYNRSKSQILCFPAGKATSFAIPEVVTEIQGAFCGCYSLTSVTIPDGVTTIGYAAFENCQNLTGVTLPDSVTSIESYAFYDCYALTGVTLPDSVTSIGERVFSGCGGLTSVTISNSVTSIGERAFSGCGGLTSVTIPDSLTSITWNVFNGCSGLTSVTIPDSVTYIGPFAFGGCDALTDVYYPGTAEEWKAVEIDSSNDALKKAEIHYAPTRRYDVTRDAWRFGNSAQDFGYQNPDGRGMSYPIPALSFAVIFGKTNAAAALYKRVSSGQWSGNCVGMSAGGALLFAGELISPANFERGNVYEMRLEDANGELDAKRLIEALQVSQYSEPFVIANGRNVIDASKLKYGRNLNALAQAIREGADAGECAVVTVSRDNAGHALLAYGYEENGDRMSVRIYDCNYPGNQERRLSLRKDANGDYRGWSYEIGGKFGVWGSDDDACSISVVPYAALAEIWENRGRIVPKMAVMSLNTENAEIRNIWDETVAELENGRLVTDSEEIFQGPKLTLTGASTELLYLPPDYYAVVNRDASGAAMTVGLSLPALAATVTTTAEEVKFSLDASTGLNSVSVTNPGVDDLSTVEMESYDAAGNVKNALTVSAYGLGADMVVTRAGDDAPKYENLGLTLIESVDGAYQAESGRYALKSCRIDKAAGSAEVGYISAGRGALYAVCYDSGGQMLEVLRTDADAVSGSAVLRFQGDLPQGGSVKALLLDADGLAPLCPAYRCQIN